MVTLGRCREYNFRLVCESMVHCLHPHLHPVPPLAKQVFTKPSFGVAGGKVSPEGCKAPYLGRGVSLCIAGERDCIHVHPGKNWVCILNTVSLVLTVLAK